MQESLNTINDKCGDIDLYFFAYVRLWTSNVLRQREAVVEIFGTLPKKPQFSFVDTFQYLSAVRRFPSVPFEAMQHSFDPTLSRIIILSRIYYSFSDSTIEISQWHPFAFRASTNQTYRNHASYRDDKLL